MFPVDIRRAKNFKILNYKWKKNFFFLIRLGRQSEFVRRLPPLPLSSFFSLASLIEPSASPQDSLLFLSGNFKGKLISTGFSRWAFNLLFPRKTFFMNLKKVPRSFCLFLSASPESFVRQSRRENLFALMSSLRRGKRKNFLILSAFTRSNCTISWWECSRKTKNLETS